MNRPAGKILMVLLPLLACTLQGQSNKTHEKGGPPQGAAAKPAAPAAKPAPPAAKPALPAAKPAPPAAKPAPPAAKPVAPAPARQAGPDRGSRGPDLRRPPEPLRPAPGRGPVAHVPPPPVRHEAPPRHEAHRPPPRMERHYGFAHPPQDHRDREGFHWIAGRGGHEGRWAPLHRPSHRHVWIPGHWNGPLWINGHWALRR